MLSVSVTLEEAQGMRAQPLFLNPSCVCIFMNRIFCLRTLDWRSCTRAGTIRPAHLHKRPRAFISESLSANYGENMHAADLWTPLDTGKRNRRLASSARLRVTPVSRHLLPRPASLSTIEPAKPAREKRHYLCFLRVTTPHVPRE